VTGSTTGFAGSPCTSTSKSAVTSAVSFSPKATRTFWDVTSATGASRAASRRFLSFSVASPLATSSR
jgi:response regulator of citrate/malate metabolism